MTFCSAVQRSAPPLTYCHMTLRHDRDLVFPFVQYLCSLCCLAATLQPVSATGRDVVLLWSSGTPIPLRTPDFAAWFSRLQPNSGWRAVLSNVLNTRELKPFLIQVSVLSCIGTSTCSSHTSLLARKQQDKQHLGRCQAEATDITSSLSHANHSDYTLGTTRAIYFSLTEATPPPPLFLFGELWQQLVHKLIPRK